MFRSKKDGLSFIFTKVISAITNNLKDGMGLKMKMLISWVFTEKSDFWWRGEGVHENPIYRGELPKKGTWTVCKGRACRKRGWW